MEARKDTLGAHERSIKVNQNCELITLYLFDRYIRGETKVLNVPFAD